MNILKNFFKQNILLSKNAFISVFNILILLFLPFISLFLLQYIDLYAVNKGFGVILKWIINNVPIVIFNYLIWLSIIVLIYGLSGRFKATYITYILITLFIGAVEYLKLSNMGVPVLPWDTSKISEGLWSLKVMVGGINFYLIITLISLILIAVIIAIIKKVIKSNIKFCLKKFLPSHLPIRLASICLSLFFLISIFNFWKSPFAEMIEKSGAKTMLWDQKTSYERNGFFLSFVINEQYMHVSKPQSYSKEVIQSYNKNLEPKLDIKNKPVIIMILSESFWDITNVNGLRFSKDPLPTVHSLM
ncbi:MAG: hypothetical protein Q8865_04610 [Bacillota bacterium]|nr:hypothetical protein [Bacillota bacterium]